MNKKLKTPLIILICLLVLLTVTEPGVASTNSYDFSSLGFSIDIPADMVVITTDNVDEYADYLIEDYYKAIKSGSMPFFAVNTAMEISCIAYSFEESKESSGMGDDYLLLNLNQFDDAGRQEYLDSLSTAFADSSEWSTLLGKSIYQSNDAYYTVLDFYNDVDGERYFFSHFSTVYNGNYYVYRVCYYNGEITGNQKQKVKDMLDSIIYTATDEQLNTMMQVQESIDKSSGNDLADASSFAILEGAKAGAIGAIVIFIFMVLKRNFYNHKQKQDSGNE